MRLSVFARRSFGLSQDKLLPKQSHSSLQGDCFAHFIRSQRREGVGFVFHSSYLLCLFSRLCKELKRRSNLLINESAGNRVPNQKCVATSATTLTAFTEAFVVFLRYNVRYKHGLVFTRLCEASFCRSKLILTNSEIASLISFARKDGRESQTSR